MKNIFAFIQLTNQKIYTIMKKKIATMKLNGQSLKEVQTILNDRISGIIN